MCRLLLRPKERLSLAVVVQRLSPMEDRLPLVQEVALREGTWERLNALSCASSCAYGSAGIPGPAPQSWTPSRSRPRAWEAKSAASTRPRRWKGGSDTCWWTPRGPSAPSAGSQRQGTRPRRHQAAFGASARSLWAPFSPVGRGRIPGKGQALGTGGDGLERGGGAQAQEASPREGGTELWALGSGPRRARMWTGRG
jgi:hypothetical protein